MPARSFSLIAYDFDGTLVDTKDDIALSVNLALEEMSLPKRAYEEIYSFVGHGVLNLMRKAINGVEHIEEEHALKVFRKYYREHLLDQTQFYPNCLEVLAHFSRKTQAIVSNKPEEFVKLIVDGLGQMNTFSSIYGGDSVPNKKPDPEMVLRLLQERDTPPQDTLLIGDSPQDIEAGRRAGVVTCGVTWGLRPPEEVIAARPDYLIHDIIELKKLVA